MNNFFKGVTSAFMMSRNEWNNDWWNLKKCSPVMSLIYTHNIINLM